MIKLDSQLVKIFERNGSLIVQIAQQKGGAIEMMPFTNDLRGAVGALSIAQDAFAGKFWPSHQVTETIETEKITYVQKN